MNRTAIARQRLADQRRGDVGRGTAPGVTRFSAKRSADRAILNVGHLPCELQSAQLQDETGAFLFLPGYSEPSGGDLVIPSFDSTTWTFDSDFVSFDME